MPKDGEFDKDLKIKKIIVVVPPKLVSSTTAKDTAIDDNVQLLLNEAVLQVQIADKSIHYIPVALCLGNVAVNGDLEYSQGTASDGSYAYFAVANVNGKAGAEVNLDIKAGESLKVFFKSSTTPNLGTVTVILECEPLR